jgi:hypothetical protein
MGLSVFQRLAGTIMPYFRIGQVGPTIRQGTDNPDTAAVAGSDGDVYIRYGTSTGVYQMSSGVWLEQGNVSLNRTLVTTAEFTATNQQYYLGINRDGTVTIYLPPGIENKSFVFKDEGGHASSEKTITLIPYGSETIDGSTSYVINTPRYSITLVFGDGWHCI